MGGGQGCDPDWRRPLGEELGRREGCRVRDCGWKAVEWGTAEWGIAEWTAEWGTLKRETEGRRLDVQ